MIIEKEKFLKLIEKSITKFVINIQNGEYNIDKSGFISDTLIDLVHNTKIFISYKGVQFTIEKLRSNDKEYIIKSSINNITLNFKITQIEFEDLSTLIQKEFEERQRKHQIKIETMQQKMFEDWENDILNRK